MSTVFISYAREDERLACEIAEEFKKKGWTVWTDQSIRPGQTWAQIIGKTLEDAACVVVLWSPNSASSQWVRKEARSGLRRNVLVPVLIEAVDIPEEFGHIQAADLTQQGFRGRRELDALFVQVDHLLTQYRVKIEREKSHYTSLFTTMLTCVVLGLLLQQVLTAEVMQQLHVKAAQAPSHTTPFLLLVILLFALIEHWRVLHVAHTENDIATLYLDILTFGCAFISADGYRAAMGIAVDPAGG